MRAKRALKSIFGFLGCIVVVLVALRFGPSIYYRFWGTGNISWISERFSEDLKEKNELVVFETTLTGQETVKQNAWLLGTVQEVIIPYSYSISFVVDLSRSQVTLEGSTIQVRLPAPKANYSKLTVDEEQMKKRDWLYPLTPERYAAIKAEIEAKLYEEAAKKPDYLDAAWNTAVKNMETLFESIASQSSFGATGDIQVIMEPALIGI